MLIDLPSTRPVFAYAQDYLHGERVELHRHSRAQLIHALSGVVTVGTAEAPGWCRRDAVSGCRPVSSMPCVSPARCACAPCSSPPQARHDLPRDCRVVDVPPLLRQLIVAAMRIAPDYPPGGRDERVMELILDELRVLPILALHVPQPVDPRLAALCRSLRAEPAADWSLGDAARRAWASARGPRPAPSSAKPVSASSSGCGACACSPASMRWRQGTRSSRSHWTSATTARAPSAPCFRRTLGVSPSLYFGRGAACRVVEGD